MIPKSLQVLEIELRCAVEGQRFEEAARLSTQYCRLALDQIARLPERGAAAREIVMRVRDVLEYAHVRMRMARSAIAARLLPLSLINLYLNSPKPGTRLHLQA